MAADEADTPGGADRPVQAAARGPFLGEGLPQCRPRLAHLAQAVTGPGQRGEYATERRNPGHPVCDRVVHPHVQADPPVRQPRKQPDLPQRPGPVQLLAAQPLDSRQQPGLVGGGGQGLDADVVADVEFPRVDPQRSTQPAGGPAEDLTEPGDAVQPRADRRAYVLDASRPSGPRGPPAYRTPIAPMSCGQPKSSGQSMARSAAFSRSTTYLPRQGGEGRRSCLGRAEAFRSARAKREFQGGGVDFRASGFVV